MDEQIHEAAESQPPQFVTEADWVPSFWNYLLNLDREDLIAELIQNDLDQDATRTVISFEPARLICEGNGRPVEQDGWDRLRKIQGAGDSVAAKRGKIGVKNHGLKTAFTIGDEIRLMSAGQSITQTLYAKGRNRPPHPGASPQPRPDSKAPATGCRIIIKYRHAPIAPTVGEANLLAPVQRQDIDELFQSACRNTAEQFAGIVSPDLVPRYEIVLRHWQLGEAHFVFSCTRTRRIAKRIEIFRRRCAISGNFSPLPAALEEEAARRLVPLKGRLRQRVADFFRRGNRFFVEVSWVIDTSGRPHTGTGRFRYPIGYPPDSHEARTGHGVYFNAPISSDNKRHGPARNEATNKDLRQTCESLLLDTFAYHAIPRWAADGLNPLVPPSSAENVDEAVRPILGELTRRGAMPTLTWRAARDVHSKNHKKKTESASWRALGRNVRDCARKYRLVIPVTTWAPHQWNRTLSLLCPRREVQLAPQTDPRILDLMTDRETPGFGTDFISFDEDDAFCRALHKQSQFFAPVAEPQREFAHVLLARSYLDLIELALAQQECTDEVENALSTTLLLPDATGVAKPLRTMYSGLAVPADLPGLRLPPLLHSFLVTHPLFKRKKWRRPEFTMPQFLEGGTLQNANDAIRRGFWNWLLQNGRHIDSLDWSKLAEIAIWPDSNGNYTKLQDLCNPRSHRLARVLGPSIRLPHEQVRRLISIKRKGPSIRSAPTDQEIRNWLQSRAATFVVGSKPDVVATEALSNFQADLGVLLTDRFIATAIKATRFTLPSLAQDGSIQWRTMIVVPEPDNLPLALCPRFLLKDRRWAALDLISPALPRPTIAMMLDTFAEDSDNFSALHARLEEFLILTKEGSEERLQLANLPILPVHGRRRSPTELAFTGTKDFWGTWKTRIAPEGLSQDDQRRYRAAGVTSALPNSDTSRAFFEWLAHENEATLRSHMPCVLRHILHRDGPAQWGEIFSDAPWIPVEGQQGMRLVSLQKAQRGPVYLRDAMEIAEAVLQSDSAVLLVIDHVKEVTEPISGVLRKLGVRSLRETLSEPEQVFGIGKITPASEAALQGLSALRSSKFQRTFLKRLTALGVETELVRHDWQGRLSKIDGIQFADKVQARYRFRGRTYTLEIDAGFDRASGTFWMKRSRRIGLSSLYEAIAAQLVFKSSARPMHLLTMDRAVELEIQDRSFGKTEPASEIDEAAAKASIRTTESDAHEQENAEESTDVVEAIFGHSPFEPDPTRNAPEPRPISAKPTRTPRLESVDEMPAGNKRDVAAKRVPELEKEHIETLKRNHYGSHCQMCLCERSPQELAPTGSYIEWEEVRRRVVEAHHLDLKSARGVRHAGNLILLCKLHHDNFGRRLTRMMITAALKRRNKGKRIRFGQEDDVKSEVNGRVVELRIPDTGEIIRIFFTPQHADFWLSYAVGS